MNRGARVSVGLLLALAQSGCLMYIPSLDGISHGPGFYPGRWVRPGTSDATRTADYDACRFSPEPWYRKGEYPWRLCMQSKGYRAVADNGPADREVRQ